MGGGAGARVLKQYETFPALSAVRLRCCCVFAALEANRDAEQRQTHSGSQVTSHPQAF